MVVNEHIALNIFFELQKMLNFFVTLLHNVLEIMSFIFISLLIIANISLSENHSVPSKLKVILLIKNFSPGSKFKTGVTVRFLLFNKNLTDKILNSIYP